MEIVIAAALIGLIPAAIAKSKGRSFGLWWLYGALIFIVALPHALLMDAEPGSDAATKLEAQRRLASGIDFHADGVFEGAPYRVENGSIVALVGGRAIAFPDMESFKGAIRPVR